MPHFEHKEPALLLCFAALLILSCRPVSAQENDSESQANAHSRDLAERNGAGTNTALQQELLQMREEDQGIRTRLTSAPEQQRAEITKQMEEIDAQLTTKLKKIVAEKGWPTIALVGAGASGGAALILIHSPDHDWQEALLPRLRKLVEEGKISGTAIATLTDKFLVSRGKLQIFGTQFQEVDGKMVMEPVENPEHLEERRSQYSLPPMSEYRKLLRDAYHIPVE